MKGLFSNDKFATLVRLTMCFIFITVAWSFASSAVLAQKIVEDWDTTAEIPDASRGWSDNFGPVAVLSGADTGNFATTGPRFTAINLVGVPDFDGVTNGFANAYVGNKSYRDMMVTEISFIARLDLSNTAVNSLPASIVLLTSDEVPDPNFPGQFVRPQIWSTSMNEMVLGEGWEEFTFPVDFTSETIPDGWNVYPDTNEAWNTVKNNVDQILVVFNFYTFGIIGIDRLRDNSLDNFTLVIETPPFAVSSMNTWAIALLVMFLLTLGSLSVLRRSC